MKSLSKDDLLPRRQKGESVHGPAHDGGPKPGFYSEKPVLASHPHSVANVAGQTDHTNVHAAMGKPPKPKRAFTDQVPLHTSAERQTAQGVALGGDHSSALDAMSGAMVPAKDGSTAAPLGQGFANAGGVVKNHNRPVETSFGMRSRTNFDADGPEGVGAAHARAQQNKDHSETRIMSLAAT